MYSTVLLFPTTVPKRHRGTASGLGTAQLRFLSTLIAACSTTVRYHDNESIVIAAPRAPRFTNLEVPRRLATPFRLQVLRPADQTTIRVYLWRGIVHTLGNCSPSALRHKPLKPCRYQHYVCTAAEAHSSTSGAAACPTPALRDPSLSQNITLSDLLVTTSHAPTTTLLPVDPLSSTPKWRTTDPITRTSCRGSQSRNQ